jgi:hypothetical protein
MCSSRRGASEGASRPHQSALGRVQKRLTYRRGNFRVRAEVLQHRIFQAVIVLLVAASVSRGAWAQGDKAAAEGLFSEGRRLMAAGDYASACEKFSASRKLDDGLGTTLNLADCYEKLGRTASAWAEFRDAAAVARRTGARGREQHARERAAALEKKLSRLTLNAATTEPNVRISRDGEPVDRGVLGSPIPVNPGSHTVEAVAAGKKKWSVVVDVPPGSQITVAIPALEADAAGQSARSTSPAKRDDTVPTGAPGSTQRIFALGVGGIGVAGLVVGSIFGLEAKADWADAKALCTNYPRGCSNEAVANEEAATHAATISNIAFGLGLAGLAGGAVLWLTAPSADPNPSRGGAPLSVGFDGRQAIVRGTFQ